MSPDGLEKVPGVRNSTGINGRARTTLAHVSQHNQSTVSSDYSTTTAFHYHLSDTPHSLLTLVLLSCFVILVIACTLIGNTLVCLAVALVRKLRHQPANYLLVSLAVADLCVGVMVMPLAFFYLILDKWPFGQVVCDIWTSADVTLCTASILNLCAISVDRYSAIVRPLTYGPKRTVRRMLAYVLVVWVLAFLISSLPPIAFWSRLPPGVCQVSQNTLYQVYATMGSFYIPATIIMVVNYKIFKAARRLTLADKKATAFSGSAAKTAHTVAAVAGVVVTSTPVLRSASGATDTTVSTMATVSTTCNTTMATSSSASSAATRQSSSQWSFMRRTPSGDGHSRLQFMETEEAPNRVLANFDDDEDEEEDGDVDGDLDTERRRVVVVKSDLAKDTTYFYTVNHHCGLGKVQSPRQELSRANSGNWRHRLEPIRMSISRRLTDVFITFDHERRGRQQHRRLTCGATPRDLCETRMHSSKKSPQRARRDICRASSRHIHHGRLNRNGSSCAYHHYQSRRHHHHQHNATSTETKAMKTLGFIMGAFITCWLPFFTVTLFKALCWWDVCRVPGWLESLVLWLGYANSTLNPLLYAKYNRDFRIPFREMLCCRFSTLQSVLRMEEYMDTFGSGRSSSEAAVLPHVSCNKDTSNSLTKSPSSTIVLNGHPKSCSLTQDICL